MQKKILLFLFIITFSQNLFSQNCGSDSVVTQRAHENEDGQITLTIRVDSFAFATGNVYTSVSIGVDSMPGLPTYSQSTFVRHLISYNANHDTLLYLKLQGNGAGYDSLSKIEFTYNAFNLPLSRNEYSFTGSTANLIRSEVWTYNANNRILSCVLSGSSGNISQVVYTYSGNQGVSVTFQNWIGGSWLDIKRYLFTYSGSLRDSLYLQRWDANSTVWVDSLNAKFDTTSYNPAYCANLSRTDSTGTINYEHYIDTLNNVIKNVENISGDTRDTVWNYFNSHLKIVHIDYSITGYNSGTNYLYDQFGFLQHESFSGLSSMTFWDSNFYYDSLNNLLQYNSSTHSGVTDRVTNIYYTYSSRNNISLSYFNINDYAGELCLGDSLQTIPIVNGGCGPYQFSWIPSTRLSSSSIANPKISLNDTINYQVTVTDSTGHSAVTTFTAFSELAVTILFDSTLCSGCPVNLTLSGSGNAYQWYRNDTIIPGATGPSYTAVTSGSYSVRVFRSYCTFFTDPVQLNITGLSRLMGNVFLDLDSNCIFNSGDRGMSMYGSTPFLIKLSRGNYTGYIIPDSSGNFDFPIDTGSFLLSIINPAPFYTSVCPDSGIISVNVLNFGDTISGINLVLKPIYTCHRLGVYLTAGRYRPCLPVDIQINYFNEGSIDENSPLINVSIPPELIVLSASQPYILLPNNALSFSLPPLTVGDQGVINIQATVDCNPVDLMGATVCIDAEILSVDFCSLQPDSTWDGSNIRVMAFCENDSNVCFTIINDSTAQTGNMNTTSSWRLYADNVLIQQGTFILNAGQDSTLCFASDGRTFRLEADQLPGFPLNNYPSASIERCGVLPSGGNYSLNQILQHPVNNALPFYYTYCNIVRNAYDPNEKSVQPTGQYTNGSQRLKYRIDFQNTGTDTALKVMIMDLISTNLDITSLQLLGSSHPFHFRIDNRNLIWEFDPILLPDSNVDEQGSHGYVEFSLYPIPNLPIGNTIRNFANIYFDYNSPIITNNTFNVICDPKEIEFSLRPLSTYCPGQPFSVVADIINNSVLVYSWYINNNYISSNDTLINANIQPGSQIKLNLTKVYPCSSPNNALQFLTVTYTYPVITYVSPSLISSPGIAFQWYMNGVVVTGATSIAYTPVASGLYQVQTTDSNGCMQLSNSYNFIYSGVKENHQTLNLFPNPSDDYTVLVGKYHQAEICIMDLTGKIIRKLENYQSSEKIYTGDLLPGGYILQVNSDSYISNTLLIIQRDGK